jgi:tetratricopeptide (TPR) repeat protein
MNVPNIIPKPLILIIFLVMIFGCNRMPEQKLQEADKLFTQARLFVDQQNYLEGLRTIRQAIDLNNELKRDSVLGENYFLLANVQRSLGQYDSALAGFKIALEYFRLTGEIGRAHV